MHLYSVLWSHRVLILVNALKSNCLFDSVRSAVGYYTARKLTWKSRNEGHRTWNQMKQAFGGNDSGFGFELCGECYLRLARQARSLDSMLQGPKLKAQGSRLNVNPQDCPLRNSALGTSLILRTGTRTRTSTSKLEPLGAPNSRSSPSGNRGWLSNHGSNFANGQIRIVLRRCQDICPKIMQLRPPW